METKKYSLHKEICGLLNKTYIAKNIAYGNSFGKSFKEFGIISAVVRLEDKWNRIKSLAKGAENKVEDESIKDTLLDMANYCIMTLIELEDNKK